MRRAWIIVCLVMVSLVAATMLDRAVSTLARDSGAEEFLRSHRAIRETIKSGGEFWFTIIVAIGVALAHPLRWRGGVFVLLASLVSGFNGLIKWIVGRTRPFHLFDDAGAPRLAPMEFSPFRGGIAGLFVSKNLCFPSGHAALAFATAEALAILYPRARGWFYVPAALVAGERVMENSHYLSDAVAGASLGFAGVHLIHWLVRRIQESSRKSNELLVHG